ncbi:hypothetical protein [Coralloluteibacterium stylophorae]|uniref:Uncharacterized protein n=1 Tax=Coralloluteibacterium stylophorae TaxID=1776034 RepID=A0A8J7VSH7_9GAMM|nr:hypothetical protein [Coralloluteibacterium stylophorae]MBS7456864.1 hypothetical protein [Coralloluteibacterium stylophorae]
MAVAREDVLYQWVSDDTGLLVRSRPLKGPGVLVLVIGGMFAIAPLRADGAAAWFACAVGIALLAWSRRILLRDRTWRFDVRRREIVARLRLGRRERVRTVPFDAVRAVEVRMSRGSTVQESAFSTWIHTVHVQLDDGEGFTVYQGDREAVLRRREQLALLVTGTATPGPR